MNVRGLIGLASTKTSVFGLADAELVTSCFEVRNECPLVVRVLDADDDVDDGLGGQVGHGCGTDVLDEAGAVAEDGA